MLKINALSVIFQIIAKNNFMGTHMGNAYAMLAIMMMAKIIYANNVLAFGNLIIIINNSSIFLSNICSYNITDS